MLDTLEIIIMGIVEFFVTEIKEFLGITPIFDPPSINIFDALAAAIENYLSLFFA